MKLPRNHLTRFGALASSLLIVGTYVGYRVLGSSAQASSQPPVSPQSSVPADPLAADAPAVNEELLSGSKSAPIFTPALKKRPMMGGSKVLVPLVEPEEVIPPSPLEPENPIDKHDPLKGVTPKGKPAPAAKPPAQSPPPAQPAPK